MSFGIMSHSALCRIRPYVVRRNVARPNVVRGNVVRPTVGVSRKDCEICRGDWCSNHTSVHEVASGREKEVINGREREEKSRKGAEDRKEKIEQKLKIMYRT